MRTSNIPPLFSVGQKLDTAPEAFGFLRATDLALASDGDALRLSTDTRYQRADEPVDDRWIKGPDGAAPVGHLFAGKLGRIC